MLATFQSNQAKLTLFCIIMKKFIHFFCLNVLLLITIIACSQDVVGHWYGIGKLQVSNNYNSYLSEMVLRQKGTSVNGELLYYFKDSLVKVNLQGSFDQITRKLRIHPFPVIYYQSPSAKNSIDCMLTGNFLLITSIKESVLKGSLVSDLAHQYTVPAINFQFKKSDDTTVLVMQSDSEMGTDPKDELMTTTVKQTISTPPNADTKLSTNITDTKERPKKTAAPSSAAKVPTNLADFKSISATTTTSSTNKAPTNLADNKERSSTITTSSILSEKMLVLAPQTLQVNPTFAEASIAALLKRGKLFTKELEVDNNQLRLEIYDNGQIDYDSVSLFLNNKLILGKSLLNHKAIRLTIELDPNLEFNELSMLAENLGMIPPNTAALIIYDGKIRYETLLTSDFSKSATIKLVKKK